MKGHSITLRRFRDKLAEILLYADAPVVVAKDQVPLGIFLPVKVWARREESGQAREAVRQALERSGVDEAQAQRCLDEYLARRRRSRARGRAGTD